GRERGRVGERLDQDCPESARVTQRLVGTEIRPRLGKRGSELEVCFKTAPMDDRGEGIDGGSHRDDNCYVTEAQPPLEALAAARSRDPNPAPDDVCDEAKKSS